MRKTSTGRLSADKGQRARVRSPRSPRLFTTLTVCFSILIAFPVALPASTVFSGSVIPVIEESSIIPTSDGTVNASATVSLVHGDGEVHVLPEVTLHVYNDSWSGGYGMRWWRWYSDYITDNDTSWWTASILLTPGNYTACISATSKGLIGTGEEYELIIDEELPAAPAENNMVGTEFNPYTAIQALILLFFAGIIILCLLEIYCREHDRVGPLSALVLLVALVLYESGSWLKRQYTRWFKDDYSNSSYSKETSEYREIADNESICTGICSRLTALEGENKLEVLCRPAVQNITRDILTRDNVEMLRQTKSRSFQEFLEKTVELARERRFSSPEITCLFNILCHSPRYQHFLTKDEVKRVETVLRAHAVKKEEEEEERSRKVLAVIKAEPDTTLGMTQQSSRLQEKLDRLSVDLEAKLRELEVKIKELQEKERGTGEKTLVAINACGDEEQVRSSRKKQVMTDTETKTITSTDFVVKIKPAAIISKKDDTVRKIVKTSWQVLIPIKIRNILGIKDVTDVYLWRMSDLEKDLCLSLTPPVFTRNFIKSKINIHGRISIPRPFREPFLREVDTLAEFRLILNRGLVLPRDKVQPTISPTVSSETSGTITYHQVIFQLFRSNRMHINDIAAELTTRRFYSAFREKISSNPDKSRFNDYTDRVVVILTRILNEWQVENFKSSWELEYTKFTKNIAGGIPKEDVESLLRTLEVFKEYFQDKVKRTEYLNHIKYCGNNEISFLIQLRKDTGKKGRGRSKFVCFENRFRLLDQDGRFALYLYDNVTDESLDKAGKLANANLLHTTIDSDGNTESIDSNSSFIVLFNQWKKNFYMFSFKQSPNYSYNDCLSIIFPIILDKKFGRLETVLKEVFLNEKLSIPLEIIDMTVDIWIPCEKDGKYLFITIEDAINALNNNLLVESDELNVLENILKPAVGPLGFKKHLARLSLSKFSKMLGQVSTLINVVVEETFVTSEGAVRFLQDKGFIDKVKSSFSELNDLKWENIDPSWRNIIIVRSLEEFGKSLHDATLANRFIIPLELMGTGRIVSDSSIWIFRKLSELIDSQLNKAFESENLIIGSNIVKNAFSSAEKTVFERLLPKRLQGYIKGLNDIRKIEINLIPKDGPKVIKKIMGIVDKEYKEKNWEVLSYKFKDKLHREFVSLSKRTSKRISLTIPENMLPLIQTALLGSGVNIPGEEVITLIVASALSPQLMKNERWRIEFPLYRGEVGTRSSDYIRYLGRKAHNRVITFVTESKLLFKHIIEGTDYKYLEDEDKYVQMIEYEGVVVQKSLYRKDHFYRDDTIKDILRLLASYICFIRSELWAYTIRSVKIAEDNTVGKKVVIDVPILTFHPQKVDKDAVRELLEFLKLPSHINEENVSLQKHWTYILNNIQVRVKNNKGEFRIDKIFEILLKLLSIESTYLCD